MSTSLKRILVLRRYLLEAKENEFVDATESAYLNAFLLSNFGIVVDKPNKLTPLMVEAISEVYKLNVPSSFYKNPQDTKFYSKSELLIEQLVSYFLVETGTGIYDRVEIFEKDLPEYKVGKEIKLREFRIVSVEEAKNVLSEIAKAYCAYTRPFSEDELEEFALLEDSDYVPADAEIRCKDNIFSLLKKDVNFARYLDKKDLVKLSVNLVGEHSEGFTKALKECKDADLIRQALPLVRSCPMTKKQAKYFNKLVSACGKGKVKMVEPNSPHKKAIALVKAGKIVEAAEVYAKSGSLLERNLRMLLSRANPQEACQIIDMVKAQNPIVLFQLITSLEEEAGQSRTFTFFARNKVRKHKETDYETKWRKSRLSSGTIKFLHQACVEKIYAYYRSLTTLGKVYIADNFYKLGVPTNTSASGKGIDAMPTGSRLALRGSAVRTFVTWKDIYDIDASITLLNDKFENKGYIYFGNYSCKPAGNDILFSGDCRNSKGTEYFDIRLDNVRARGFRYLAFSFHGYSGRLNEGEIYCGYQNKDNLDTIAWDPKNIEVQFKVFGDTRACSAFAIDLETKEMVFLNLMLDDEQRVVNGNNAQAIEKWLNPEYLEINIGKIAENRAATLVETPEEADVVFDDSYVASAGKEQKVIRSYELEKLVALVNEK